MPDVSVITINKGRDGHLSRLLEGLARGPRPKEIIVVAIGARDERRDDDGVVHVPLPVDGLPLAQARNAGRRAASGDILIFLDVDCIPSPELVPALTASVVASDGLVCCEIFYLFHPVSDGWTHAGLRAGSMPHAARQFPKRGAVAAPQPGLFWSLAFGVSAITYDRLGGFDETYAGYGAEDTDLAFRAAAQGIPILFNADGHAFHQRHDAHDPPLGHFADIVRNATIFRRKHGRWPMEGWLDAFARLGLIAIDADAIHVLHQPSQNEIERAAIPAGRAF